VTLTRWHEDDLAGRLIEAAKIEGGDQWDIIQLPAIRDTSVCDYDVRAEGEPLWPGKYNSQRLATIKATVGSYDWASLYQQQPSPGDGGLFKREWWRRWAELPSDLFDYTQSWDCAFKATSNSDYVVGQVWARSKRNPAQRYLLDQVRDKMTFTETVQAVRDLSAKWPRATRKLIEDTANGPAIIDELKRCVPGIIPVNPRGGKSGRAHAVTAVVEAGNVFLPAHASWASDLIEELSAFPSGAHDDQVDALTQANIYYNNNPGIAAKLSAFVN
jgi:predicted phage terminase large subunit-like protein